MELASIVTLELSTKDVETVIEVPANTVFNFVGDVAGNLGMIFGMSLFGVFFSSTNQVERYLLAFIQSNETWTI